MQKSLETTIKDNVSRLAKKHDLNTVSFGKKTGIDQKTVYNLLNPEKSNTLPTTRTLQSISETFKIEYWKIVFPSMPLDLMTDQRLSTAIMQLANCTPKNRDKIFDLINDIARLDSLDRNHSSPTRGIDKPATY